MSKEQVLKARLGQIQKAKLPRITFSLEDPSYERQVQQDEEYLRRIKSFPLEEEQQRLRGKLEKAIKDAVKWGMHKDPWTITRETLPGQKNEIDVPIFIKNLAHYLEIPLADKKR